MKKIISLILALTIASGINASASVLGDTLKDSSSLPMGQGLTLYSNTFLSDQNGVGNQTEYYAEYTPNTYVRPIVMTGERIYGKRTAKEAVDYMTDNNMVPMIGINASFFSFETGIPMGHVITNGIVTSKDNRTLPAIGFRSDGTAFIDDLYIETTACFGEDYILQIPHINKFISAETQMLTLFTPEFGDYTGTSTETLNVILENISDGVKIGGEFDCVVKEVFKSSEPVKIENGEYVLSVNTNGNQWAITLINTLTPGEEINVKTVAGNDIWNEAFNGLASEGERLLKNGNIAENLEAGAAPRTAVGITGNGNILFYVIDGRQFGYSYGARRDTVAKRLKELGCVNALNLDGGGSTTMAGVYPGCDTSVIMNSPSEGVLRKVTNFIFLQNVSNAIGKPEMAYIYPYTGKILSGSRINLDVRTTDENYYPTPAENISYSCNEYATVSENGELLALGEGTVRVNVKVSGLDAVAEYKSVITPDNIKLYNSETGAELDAIDVLPGDTINLSAQSYFDGSKLFSSNDAYRWTVKDGKCASVNENGVLKVSHDMDKNTELTVKAGAFEKTFAIRLGAEFNNAELYPYSEISLDGATLNIDMYSYNDRISADNSYFKLDGKKISLSECDTQEVDARHLSVKYSVSDNFLNEHHKIYCQTVLNNGYAALNSYFVQNAETENIFADTVNHWGKEIIAYMNKRGVISGAEEDGIYYYRPNDKITRAEFAVLTAQFLGLNTEEFKDVSLDNMCDKDTIPSWALNHVKAVYSKGIINGKEDDGMLYFDPSAYITRAEAAAIISRILPSKIEGKMLNYKDKDSIPEWAYRAVKVLSNAKLINGYSDNTLRPKNNVTRAEAVTMFYNIY